MITLLLMSQKGYLVLNNFVDSNNFDLIDAVVIGTDDKVQNDYSVNMAEVCAKNNITIKERGDAIDSKVILAISWRWIIREKDPITIVIHDSLLPKYRGFAPLVNALINGEQELGATALIATEEYDKGAIISQQKTAISYPIKIKEAIELVGDLYLSLTNEIISVLKSGDEFNTRVQNEDNASYSLWRNQDDYMIDWTKSSSEIKRTIDALGYPYLGATTTINGEKIRIIDGEIITDVKIENRDCGKVIFIEDSLPVIVCGTGLIKIKEMTDENGNSILPLKSFRSRLK